MRDKSSRPGWDPRDPTPDGAPSGSAPRRTRRQERRAERKARRRQRRTGWRRLLPTWRMVLGALFLGVLLVAGGFVAGYHLVGIPPANAAATAQSNVYLYRDGTPIAQSGAVNRENVPLAEIPAAVRHAVLAAEDRDFYTTPAVDPGAMARAAWNTVTGKGTQGGSTITQQYVKNYYLGQERTLTRKVKEFFIALKLGREKSKDEIFEGYLNTSYYGRNAYGIQAAARAYYGTDVQRLGEQTTGRDTGGRATGRDTAGQAAGREVDGQAAGRGAYLASLLNAPSAYDIVAHPQNRPRALARWNYVLDAMVKEQWLEPAERAATRFPAPGKAVPADSLSGQRGYLLGAVEDYLTGEGLVDERTLAAGGYRITTTLDRVKQESLVRAVTQQVTDRLDATSAADRNVRVGAASVEPATGRVVALYGGVDYTRQYVNNATRRDYQVGSTFKPFVFAAAVDSGAATRGGEPITPNTVYDGTNKRPVQGWSGTPYAPANEDGRSYGPITVREATDKSVNAVYAQLAVDVGPARARSTAVALGLPATTPDLTATPSVALGTATASVLDMAEAYATLANHGRHGRYTLVEKVEKDGSVRALTGRAERQAVSRQAADTTTSMLQSVVQAGTGTAARSAGRPAAGKTGTAEEDRAAWFAGYTPDLATVVAVLGQDPKTGAQRPLYGALGAARINGGGEPARIWGQYTRDALAGSPVRHFDLVLAEGAGPAEEPHPRSSPGATDSPVPDGDRQPGDGQRSRTPGPGRPEDGGGAPTAPGDGQVPGPDTGREQPAPDPDGGTGTTTGVPGDIGGGGHQDPDAGDTGAGDTGPGMGPGAGPGGTATGGPAGTYRPPGTHGGTGSGAALPAGTRPAVARPAGSAAGPGETAPAGGTGPADGGPPARDSAPAEAVDAIGDILRAGAAALGR
ncbi:transglycosylase domain-containing protein [Streptomyces sp. LP05-1]|uniref:Transglycosylase domain-containing protein n=1 Tax=Streptomyces pyxinae TaxID=2970734 RepID=A0ABT2CDF8_9ACTN|nr:transglycosylase domain-containing protein [Streptomyces sp. LP05-1]MCS0634654.1 transglycosylase domain-containing protein [Streptomyces sp. LP05-1]